MDILFTTSERIVHTFTKEEIESFAAMDLDEFIDRMIMESQNNIISPVMIQYFKTIHEICVDAVTNNKLSTDS